LPECVVPVAVWLVPEFVSIAVEAVVPADVDPFSVPVVAPCVAPTEPVADVVGGVAVEPFAPAPVPIVPLAPVVPVVPVEPVVEVDPVVCAIAAVASNAVPIASDSFIIAKAFPLDHL
jgi:hypothetical protein